MVTEQLNIQKDKTVLKQFHMQPTSAFQVWGYMCMYLQTTLQQTAIILSYSVIWGLGQHVAFLLVCFFV